MAKQRGYPDRRGMGAQSDSIAQQFVPGAAYQAEQIARVKSLLAAGVTPEQISKMFSIPFKLISAQELSREKGES